MSIRSLAARMARHAAAALFAAIATPAAAAEKITILHTNDLHGHLEAWTGWEGELSGKSVGGLDRIAAEVARIRAAAGAGRVLLLDAGDTLADTFVAHRTQGRAVVEAMNAMGYDAMVVGNHEPDFTSKVLESRIAEATFPVLAANIQRGDGRPFAKPYVIREVGGVRVGILGIAYPNTALTTPGRNVAGLRFEPAADTARRFVPQMRREGADLVVALTHLGLGADRALAEAVSGIDVIVGGHSHNRMKEALRVGGTLIVQSGAHGSDLGRLDLVVESGRVVSHSRELVAVVGEARDASVASVVARHAGPLHDEGREPVAQAQAVIARAQTLAGQQPASRDAESAADSLFADAIREETGADIAFLPGVGYGVALMPGPVTQAQLRNLLPHDSPVYTMMLTGSAIRDVLEQSIENVATKDPAQRVGGMIQVSGLRFEYDASAPRGKRVTRAMVGDHPLEPSRRYRVAVNGLLAEGGHRYRAFEGGAGRRESGRQYEMVREWLRRQRAIAAPAAGRIVKAGGGS